jgi:hypothetical protein
VQHLRTQERGAVGQPAVTSHTHHIEAMVSGKAPGLGPDVARLWAGSRCDRCYREVDGIPGYEDEEHVTVCVECVPSLRVEG